VPNWSDENGRYWYTPIGGGVHDEVEIPHAPVGAPEGCTCICCRERPEIEKRMRSEEVQVDFHGRPIHHGALEEKPSPDSPGELVDDEYLAAMYEEEDRRFGPDGEYTIPDTVPLPGCYAEYPSGLKPKEAFEKKQQMTLERTAALAMLDNAEGALAAVRENLERAERRMHKLHALGCPKAVAAVQLRVLPRMLHSVLDLEAAVTELESHLEVIS
jgi:hypothetical protein